ncbi:MAG: SagB/ThcOx family dehydrogenase [Acidobacteriota bacterium]
MHDPWAALSPSPWQMFHLHSCNQRGVVPPVLWTQGLHAQRPPWKRYRGVPTQPLAVPEAPAATLRDALDQRRSCRRFDADGCDADGLASLLHLAYGPPPEGAIDAPLLSTETRTVPSGGGRFPLELYVLARRVAGVPAGLHHYDVPGHHLAQLRGPMPWDRIVDLFLGQPPLREAAGIVVITAVTHRTLARYGERGYRMLLLEAGHLGQNLTLAAAGLGLGSLCLAGFFDGDLAMLLGLDPAVELPLYAVAFGAPGSDDPVTARLPWTMDTAAGDDRDAR